MRAGNIVRGSMDDHYLHSNIQAAKLGDRDGHLPVLKNHYMTIGTPSLIVWLPPKTSSLSSVTFNKSAATFEDQAVNVNHLRDDPILVSVIIHLYMIIQGTLVFSTEFQID